MRHPLKNSIKENMHGLLECIFVDYSNQLRANYPGRIIRNATRKKAAKNSRPKGVKMRSASRKRFLQHTSIQTSTLRRNRSSTHSFRGTAKPNFMSAITQPIC